MHPVISVGYTLVNFQLYATANRIAMPLMVIRLGRPFIKITFDANEDNKKITSTSRHQPIVYINSPSIQPATAITGPIKKPIVKITFDADENSKKNNFNFSPSTHSLHQ